ncbi:MAG: YqeG family HAD IIIA-type phosphatase [Cellulosilyticaceae bacterium]
MLTRFFPEKYLASIFELNIDELIEEGVKGIIFDIDNTLVPYDEAEPNEKIIALFERIKSKGLQITLASNNTEDRVVKFNERLKVFAIHKSKKPSTQGLRKAMQLMNLAPEEVAIVGDQVFTDVFGGNRAKIKTILVSPISEKDEWITKIKRGLEKKILKRYEVHVKKNNR